MDYEIDKELWKGSATDIVFRSPFSSETNTIRKRVFFISAIIIIHNAFPIDLTHSHVLGIAFEETSAPSISGVMGLFLVYLAVVLSIHSHQEISSWISQARSIKFAMARKNIHNIFAHHQNIDDQLKAIAYQIQQHEKLTSKIRDFDFSSEDIKTMVFNHLSEMGLHVESLKNFRNNIEKPSRKFGEGIESAKSEYEQATTQYRAAMRGQILKVGLIEMFLPFASAVLALYLCGQDVYGILFNVIAAI